ncbi:hypothetical protein HanPI659440_Chr09g0338601 [Helianthus annuus]|nr:hypothetical protein HanPI659440_Chr09g0338601 [Helianthus annuus]
MCFDKYPSSNPKNIKPHNTIHSLSRLFGRFPNLYNASIALQLLSHLKTYSIVFFTVALTNDLSL